MNVHRLPDIARSVVAAGHEIGNHTYSHPALHFKSRRFMRTEVRDAQAAIEDTSGVSPRWFRAPFGVRWFGLRNVQRELSLDGVMWSVLGLDWKWPAERVIGRLDRAATPGAIICLHDGRMTSEAPDISVTLDTIREILPIWADRGYQFETVSQILCKTN
jgi:peptidoglycan/xylan/chitin deacetylase (PgdA/CDA1 family)